jgi:hypothetical protein
MTYTKNNNRSIPLQRKLFVHFANTLYIYACTTHKVKYIIIKTYQNAGRQTEGKLMNGKDGTEGTTGKDGTEGTTGKDGTEGPPPVR